MRAPYDQNALAMALAAAVMPMAEQAVVHLHRRGTATPDEIAQDMGITPAGAYLALVAVEAARFARQAADPVTGARTFHAMNG